MYNTKPFLTNHVFEICVHQLMSDFSGKRFQKYGQFGRPPIPCNIFEFLHLNTSLPLSSRTVKMKISKPRITFCLVETLFINQIVWKKRGGLLLKFTLF